MAVGVILLGGLLVAAIRRKRQRHDAGSRPAILEPGAVTAVTATTPGPSNRPATINPVFDRSSEAGASNDIGMQGIWVDELASPRINRPPRSRPAVAPPPHALIMCTDAEGYEVPAAVNNPVGHWRTSPEGYEVPVDGGGAAPEGTGAEPGGGSVHGFAVVTTSAATYEVPYDSPGADAMTYGVPAPMQATQAQRPVTQVTGNGGGGGIRRNDTKRGPSRYDGFGAGGAAAAQPEYEQPDSMYARVDYSQVGAAPSSQHEYMIADGATSNSGGGGGSGGAANACTYVAADQMKCVGPRVGGSLQCANHTCGEPGCANATSSRVGACPEHLDTDA